MAFDGILEINVSSTASTNVVSYGTVFLTPGRSETYGVVVATNEEVTPEGYKTAMVTELLALKKARLVAVPSGTKEFLNWLNQP